MPQFDATSIGGTLDYDFTTWLGEGLDHRGTVPEPSRFAVNAMMKTVQSAFKGFGIVPEDASDSTTPGEIADRMNKVDDEDLFEKMSDTLTNTLGELCGGKPSLETLQALPYRPFMGFFGYLIGNLMNPESSASGTNLSPRRLTSA